MSTGADTFETRLDEAAESLDAAETEADLDDVEETLDAIESDLEEAVFEEADDDDDESPREDLEERIDDLRDDVEDQRGPYAEDVAEVLEDAKSTVETSEWTEAGEEDVITAVRTLLETAEETVEPSKLPDEAGEPFTLEDLTVSTDTEDENDGESEVIETVATALATAADAIGESSVDPDDDADTIATLLDAAETLTDDLDDAQVFGDLEVREQLRRQGFYDVLTPKNRKDFPPEWGAIKQYEARGEVEPILLALEMFDSDYIQENVLDALEHIAPVEAFEDVKALAQRRDTQAIRVLGRIGDDRACDMLENFLGGGDVALEQTSLEALGAIGNEESTEAVAQRLDADSPEIRTAAARSLGLIGDTRAIEPLASVLSEDDSEVTRASAAWALTQIGTERALEEAVWYTDDNSYLVETEAKKAKEALETTAENAASA